MEKLNPKGVILDLDNTLYPYDICNDYALTQVFLFIQRLLDIDIDKLVKLYEVVKHKNKMQLGSTAASHHRLLYFQYLCEEISVPSLKYAHSFYSYYWDKFFEVMQLGEGVIEFLIYCKNNMIPICLLTDLTADIQYRKIAQLDITDYINFIVTSEEVLFDKPNPIMFFIALKKIKLEANEVVMIGDSLAKDILGAQSIGIQSILFDAHNAVFHEGLVKINTFLGLESKLW